MSGAMVSQNSDANEIVVGLSWFLLFVNWHYVLWHASVTFQDSEH